MNENETFAELKKRCPAAAQRISQAVKNEQDQRLKAECKRLGKKSLTESETVDFYSKRLDELILRKQEHEIKKKLDKSSVAVQNALLSAASGRSGPMEVGEINFAKTLFERINKEPIGLSQKSDEFGSIDNSAQASEELKTLFNA